MSEITLTAGQKHWLQTCASMSDGSSWADVEFIEPLVEAGYVKGCWPHKWGPNDTRHVYRITKKGRKALEVV